MYSYFSIYKSKTFRESLLVNIQYLYLPYSKKVSAKKERN